jgi:hypothetical protein
MLVQLQEFNAQLKLPELSEFHTWDDSWLLQLVIRCFKINVEMSSDTVLVTTDHPLRFDRISELRPSIGVYLDSYNKHWEQVFGSL